MTRFIERSEADHGDQPAQDVSREQSQASALPLAPSSASLTTESTTGPVAL